MGDGEESDKGLDNYLCPQVELERVVATEIKGPRVHGGRYYEVGLCLECSQRQVEQEVNLCKQLTYSSRSSTV